MPEKRINEFLASKRARSNFTVANYSTTLRQFSKIHSKMPDLEQLAEFLDNPAWSQNTKALKYNILHEFYNFCERAYGDRNLIQLLDRPKTEVKPVPSLGLTDVKTLLSQPMKAWHRAIIMLILDTGIRVGECLDLKWDNIDWENRRVFTKGKTGNYTNIVSQKVLDLLAELPRNSDRVFPYKRGAVLWMIGHKFRKMNLNTPHNGPHMFRHTFARLSIKNGASLPFVQQSLHHKKLTTTQRYIYLDEQDLKEAHDKHSPINMLESIDEVDNKDSKGESPVSRGR